MDYKIFPVEFYSIVEELKNNSFNVSDIEKKEAENNCIYLKNHECLIYNSRPIICRSHGLPLLYTNDEGEWELSACELNFTEFENGFTEENTFPQDKFNSKLFMINKKFIQESKEKKFAEFELISIKEIIKFLV
ncbi:MAG: YkgJ family cysteine cluster protein [Prolixibacteraceae bacterium]|nr:YkgJ family cysteine cluster protein [Prolixibacteraceae bacterium]MBN2774048.1 YkgJ family cysteine cluster protein [Prolixibacteraceae bacterium]